MQNVTITKTKQYLIFKIPLASIEAKESSHPSREEKAVIEGLNAVADGRVSKTFNGAKTAIAFLRSL